jgi:hypothetical protein
MPIQGYEATREAAMKAFAESWHREKCVLHRDWRIVD